MKTPPILRPALIAACSLLLCAASAHAQIAPALTEGFVAGNGTGITYIPDSNFNPSNTTYTGGGGDLWVEGNTWLRNGAGVNRQVKAGNYLSWTNVLSNVETTVQLRREFKSQGTSPYELNFRVEMANLAGLNLTDPTYTDPTTGTTNATRAKAFFAINNTPSTSRLSLTETSWYIEASAGYWHVLAGNGLGTGFATPVALAPIVVGETYDISVRILASTWEVEIHAINADLTYSLTNLAYINDTISNYVTMRTYADNVAATSDNQQFEINVHEISLNQIPEPSQVAIALAAAALLVAGLVRSKRRAA